MAETVSPRKTGKFFDLKNFHFYAFFQYGHAEMQFTRCFSFFPETRMPRKQVGALTEMFVSIGSSVYRDNCLQNKSTLSSGS